MASTLTKGPGRFIPAQSFFWGDVINGGEKLFQEATTSGSGAGSTKDAAVLSALYELIERDNFLLFWFSGVQPTRIVIDDVPGIFFEQIRRSMKNYNIEVYFFDITYDINVLACMCLIIDPVLNIVSIGGKVSAEGENTLKGAYLEALATLNLVRSRNMHMPEDVLKEIQKNKSWGSDKVNKSGRVNLYNSSYGVSLMREMFLTNNNKTILYIDYNSRSRAWVDDTTELRVMLTELDTLVRTKGDGYQAYVYEFSSKYTKKRGYHVAHVFIPMFLKLHLTERFVAPVSNRLIEFMQSHSVTYDGIENLNNLPHPFP